MKPAEAVLFALLALALIAWGAGCAQDSCRVTIDPDWKNGAISYYWPGQPGQPGPDSTTLDCREHRAMPLN